MSEKAPSSTPLERQGAAPLPWRSSLRPPRQHRFLVEADDPRPSTSCARLTGGRLADRASQPWQIFHPRRLICFRHALVHNATQTADAVPDGFHVVLSLVSCYFPAGVPCDACSDELMDLFFRKLQLCAACVQRRKQLVLGGDGPRDQYCTVNLRPFAGIPAKTSAKLVHCRRQRLARQYGHPTGKAPCTDRAETATERKKETKRTAEVAVDVRIP
jgi:hypothetical protein